MFIIDNSCWGISKDLPSVIEIYTPGSTKPYKSYFSKEDTSYDSIALGIVCGADACENVELPDGIYRIKITASPSTFFQEHNFLKSDQLQRDIDKAYISVINESCSGNCKSDVIEANFLLETAHAYNRMSDIKGANEAYSLSKRIIDKIVNCKNCR